MRHFGIDDCSREQVIHLKGGYLVRLSDEGILNSVLYNRPEDDGNPDLKGVSLGELADADNLIPDDIIWEEYGDAVFTEEDFP